MDTQEQIKTLVTEQPVVLFMKGTPNFPQCGFSSQAVQALQASGADFTAVNVLDDPDIREGIKRFGNWPTIPQLYINGQLIGGCDIICDLHASGKLAQLLAE